MVRHDLQPILLDGFKSVCEDLRNKFSELQIEHLIFEESNSNIKSKTITFGHVLEHELEQVLVLNRTCSLLGNSGWVRTVVPNENSLYCQAAVNIGRYSMIK